VDLPTIWFLLIAVLFTGYFVLEGFDYGVGMLLPVLGRDDRERRVLINTIGPVWDGNEVWLLTAGGAMFAAFPEWYATLFSGFYLPLLLILLALIVRGVAFEYRQKRPEATWKRRWDAAIIIGSFVPALLWGVAFANIIRGVPLTADHEYTGGLLNLLNPYALLGGAVFLAVFLTHGAHFLALKTTGEVRERANKLAGRISPVTAVLAVLFLGWTLIQHPTPAAAVLAIAAAVVFLAGLAANRAGREGWAFTGTTVTIALTVGALFASLFPNVLPSTLDAAGTLTVANAASSPHTLMIMTWVAIIFTPIVLLYQGWTYWVFRKRIGVGNIPQH
jgi:cytochrome bd ubiquinol oxidase subunit II